MVNTPPTLTRQLLLFGLAPLLLLVIGTVSWPSTGRDDTHITLWPARTLVLEGEMLNYNYERVEQSSTLFFVLLLAGLHAPTQIDLVDLAHVISVIVALASLVLLALLARKIVSERLALLVVLLSALTPTLLYWAFSGMETTLVLLFSLLFLLLFERFLEAKSFSLATFAALSVVTLCMLMVRPEMPLVLPCILIGYVVLLGLQRLRGVATAQQVQHLRRTFFLLLLLAGLIAGLVAWRVSYFGSPFPQPVMAKVGEGNFLVETLTGFLYWFLGAVGIFNTPLIVIGLWKVTSLILLVPTWLRNPSANTALNLTISFVGVYSVFIIFSGGDWMPYARFLVPIDGLIILLAVYVTVIRFAERRALVVSSALLVVSVGVVIVYYVSSPAPLARTGELQMSFENQFRSERFSWFEVVNPVNRRDLITVYHLENVVEQIQAEVDRPLNLMSLQMGLVPYYLIQGVGGELSLFDRGGLADRRVTDCALTADLSRGMIGVNLTYEAYIPLRDALQEACGIPVADVIYGLQTFTGSETAVAALQEGGYVRVYLQYEGEPSNITDSGQSIWVREEYVQYLEEPLIEIDLRAYGFDNST